jgi:hypothetical protein
MDNKETSIKEALRKVEQALGSIRYGEIIIKVQNGNPVYVDKYERERVGRYGEEKRE